MEQVQALRNDLDNSSLAVEYLQKQNGDLQRKLDQQENELLDVKYSSGDKLRDKNDNNQALVNQLQNQVVMLEGELTHVKQDGARRLSLSAERKDHSQMALIEQLREVSEEFEEKEKAFQAVSSL